MLPFHTAWHLYKSHAMCNTATPHDVLQNSWIFNATKSCWQKLFVMVPAAWSGRVPPCSSLMSFSKSSVNATRWHKLVWGKKKLVPKARQNFVLPCRWCAFEHTLLSALLFGFHLSQLNQHQLCFVQRNLWAMSRSAHQVGTFCRPSAHTGMNLCKLWSKTWQVRHQRPGPKNWSQMMGWEDWMCDPECQVCFLNHNECCHAWCARKPTTLLCCDYPLSVSLRAALSWWTWCC